jgi:teichuronic acid exporter
VQHHQCFRVFDDLLNESATDSIVTRIRRKLGSSQYLRDVLMQASGNTAAQVLGIAAMPLLTRLYAPSDFATLNLFTQLVAGLAIFLTLRFEYLVMLPAEQRESDSVLRLTVLMGGLHVLWLTPVLCILSDQWVWLRSQGAIADWVWLAPVSALAVSLAVGFQQMVQRRGDFRSSATSEFVGRSAYVACTMVGALALPNIIGLMSSTLANAGVKLVWLIRAGSNFTRTCIKPSFVPITKSIRRMALSTSASSLIALFSGMAPIIYIADRYGANALGQYGLVVSTLYLPSVLVGQAIGQVYYQRACRLHGDGQTFTDLLTTTSRNLLKIGVPLYALIALIAPFAYPIIFGAEWAFAGEMARWLCIAALASFLSTPMDRTSTIVDAWWYLSVWHTLRAVLTTACLISSAIYNLPLQTFIILLSLLNALAYGIDWAASYAFARRSSRRRLPSKSAQGVA